MADRVEFTGDNIPTGYNAYGTKEVIGNTMVATSRGASNKFGPVGLRVPTPTTNTAILDVCDAGKTVQITVLTA